ncbi:hypothetical protein GWK08_17580 [Leptobacterium flavescens]|uniref:Uncharacterized protein n=1 Tax=Leptobacterium flavescens TaxID=472055 RepID=A0A6P0URW0_9FLAO|nr:hypothetical protein [Leptobacterium flavescens]NER15272.1 hypothetical protein [Leptobacterium flavescens]
MAGKRRISKILRAVLYIILIGILGVTCYYTLKYMHWYSKSHGYGELYQIEDEYPFEPLPDRLLADSSWINIAKDTKGDGDILNWPDAKELSVLHSKDTIWVKFTLFNNIDINEPMVSLAIEDKENGRDWYGSVKDYKYGDIIATGYVRKGSSYFGYNFVQDKKGACKLYYQLPQNSLVIGIPRVYLEKYKNKRFVASVGHKALWNDDFKDILEVNDLLTSPEK